MKGVKFLKNWEFQKKISVLQSYGNVAILIHARFLALVSDVLMKKSVQKGKLWQYQKKHLVHVFDIGLQVIFNNL